MPKRNREIIMEQSMYDMLCMMNANLRTQIHHYPMALEQPCIMTAIGVKERKARCRDFGADCDKCIQSWLNDFPI